MKNQFFILVLLLGLQLYSLHSHASGEQLVWVLPTSKGVSAKIKLMQKDKGQWQVVGPVLNAVIGKRGLAAIGQKREGDLKTPQGIFDLKRIFGRSNDAQYRLSYTPLTLQSKWIDDPDAVDYNLFVEGPTQANSYEDMLRADGLYDRVLVVEYNTNPIVKGWGSAIFMHIWRSPTTGTAGCVALAREDLFTMINWLDGDKNPRVLIGPWDQVSL